jgi:hypothetical protein
MVIHILQCEIVSLYIFAMTHGADWKAMNQ